MCQLEGSDHGGRDSAAELALAGIDVQASDSSCKVLTLGSAPTDARNYTPPKKTVNGFLPRVSLSRIIELESVGSNVLDSDKQGSKYRLSSGFDGAERAQLTLVL